MELHELHVTNNRTRSPRECNTISTSARWICGLTKYLTSSTRCQNGFSGPNHRLPTLWMPHKCAPTYPFVSDQIDCESLWPNVNIWCVYSSLNNSSHHFAARSISKGMHNPVMAMPPFFTKFKLPVPLVKLGTPLNQLSNSGWSLTNNRVDNLRIAEIATSRNCIRNMVIKPIGWINDTRDAALSPLAR